MKRIIKNQFNFFILFLINIIVVSYSYWQASYNADGHHYGLMLSNAYDLIDGKIPYKEIFIQYGILTTIIHAGSLIVFGNLLSLTLITSIMYSCSIFFMYLIANNLTNKKISLLFLLLVITYHPLTVYPWSNYIAFFFITAGLIFLIKSILEKNNNFYSSLAAGLLFSLAILARENSILTIFLLLFFYIISYIYLKSSDNNFNFLFKKIYFLLIGFFIPLLVFFIYLINNNLLGYWINHSYHVPQTYVLLTPYLSGVFFWQPLFETAIKFALEFDLRWIITLLVLFLNTLIFLHIILKKTPNNTDLIIILISFFSLCSYANIVWRFDIFRFSTGSIIGLIPIFYFMDRSNLFITISKKGTQIFHVSFTYFVSIFLIFLLALNSFKLSSSKSVINSGNHFFPTDSQIKENVQINYPLVFKDNRWSSELVNHYLDFQKVISELDTLEYMYIYNLTYDAFYDVLSDFERVQLSPWFFRSEFDFLSIHIPAFNNFPPKKVCIIKQLPISQIASYKPSNNFRYYKKIKRGGDYLIFEIN